MAKRVGTTLFFRLLFLIESGVLSAATLPQDNGTGPTNAPPPQHLHTYGGTDDVSRVEVLAVYFLPRGRTPVPDWRDRIEYYARRVEAFHRREFSGQ